MRGGLQAERLEWKYAKREGEFVGIKVESCTRPGEVRSDLKHRKRKNYARMASDFSSGASHHHSPNRACELRKEKKRVGEKTKKQAEYLTGKWGSKGLERNSSTKNQDIHSPVGKKKERDQTQQKS